MEIINPLPIKETKRIGRTPRYADSYYMVMAKEVVEDGMTFRVAAAKYNCSHGTVCHWTKLYREGKLAKRIDKQKANQTTNAVQILKLERYIKELKTEVGELYLENQILKKAQLYFQRLKSESSSVITSESLDQFPEDAES